MNRVLRANFVIMDGVLKPDAIASLYRRGEPLDCRPLYLGTHFGEVHDIGPILVPPAGSSSLISETYQSDLQRPDASLIYSPAPIDIVARHLQRFITPASVRGSNMLLRFADPLATLHWLGSYQDVQPV